MTVVLLLLLEYCSEKLSIVACNCLSMVVLAKGVLIKELASEHAWLNWTIAILRACGLSG